MQVSTVGLFIFNILGVYTSRVSSLDCPANFQNISSFCLHLALEEADKSLYCDAQKKCNDVGGRLVTGWDKVQALMQHFTSISQLYMVFVGATDLLHERGATKSEFLFSDSSFLPATAGPWMTTNLNADGTDDLLALQSQSGVIKIRDRGTAAAERYACEPWPEKLPSTFNEVPFPKHNYANIYFCSETEFQTRLRECAYICSTRSECAVFLYKKSSNLCKFILHMDASLSTTYENDPEWQKYKKVWN